MAGQEGRLEVRSFGRSHGPQVAMRAVTDPGRAAEPEQAAGELMAARADEPTRVEPRRKGQMRAKEL